MVSIGNTTLPGVQTSVESASSTGVNVGAPGQIGLIGDADLTSGTAQANVVEEVRTPVKARSLFGSGSPLAENIVGALTEGAYPVFAVAAESNEILGEDLSTVTSTSGTLAEAPVSDDPSEVVFEVDGSPKTSVVTLSDPADATVGTDEVHYNPVSGDFELDAAVSTSASVDYDWYDYDSATDALLAEEGEVVDIVGVINENPASVSYAHDAAVAGVQNYDLMAVVAGASPGISDLTTYQNPYDSSRLQLLYPARDDEGNSIIGSYCGLRARLGINASPMFKRLQSVTGLSETLSADDKEHLLSSFVVPIANESRGARIIEDVTTVSEDNTDEASMRQILHRLIIDYVTEVVHENSERYIGELHTTAARNSLRSNITAELNRLMDTDSLTGFNINVEEVDAMTASVDVGIDTVDPLRNIVATISAGQVE